MAHGRPVASESVRAHPADRGSAGRHLYLDNLKVLLIAAIIALHGMGSYAGTTEVWTYTQLGEATLAAGSYEGG